jgi:hypothetical protein
MARQVEGKAYSRLRDLPYYSKTCLKRNLTGPEHFSAEARYTMIVTGPQNISV